MAMAMSTQTLRESSRLLEAAVLLDRVQILDVGEPATVGINVTRSLTEVGEPIAGLVQTSTPQGAVESISESLFSVKVPGGTSLVAGQAVRVEACLMEPDLVGRVLLIESMSLNGAALLRKGFATEFNVVNPEGKGGL